MQRLYTDEQFPIAAALRLRELGYDVLTCQESGRSNAGITDIDVLAFAIGTQRAVLTQNRRDYRRLHRKNSVHHGIVLCTSNPNFTELAQCIHQKLENITHLSGKLVCVYRPA